MGCCKSSAQSEMHSIKYVIKKSESSKIICFYLKKLERDKQIKSHVSGRKAIIWLRAEINKTKNWFFVKIDLIDNPLVRLRKKQRTQITNNRNENKLKGNKGILWTALCPQIW